MNHISEVVVGKQGQKAGAAAAVVAATAAVAAAAVSHPVARILSSPYSDFKLLCHRDKLMTLTHNLLLLAAESEY